jgi:acetyl-CoA carboxylase biotin carboxyl carrier protein
MIDLEFVEKLIRALDESSLDNLELERGGTRIRLSKSPSPCGSVNEAGRGSATPSETVDAPLPPPESLGSGVVDGAEAPMGNYIEVTSPMVGTFYRSPGPDTAPYADVGARIGQGTVLCIIEAMKLMNELESDVEGTVVKIMVEDAQPVEFGQVLFLIDPS